MNHRALFPGLSCALPGAGLGAAALALLLAGCGTAPVPAGADPSGGHAPPTTAVRPADPASAPSPSARVDVPAELRTRNAVFKRSSFEELPGWQQDDIRAGWGAFRQSCEPLRRRTEWRALCDAAQAVPPTEKAMRAFFESRFTVLRILNPDASREGEVTGYFEPLLEGQATRGGGYDFPVLGVPRGLHTLDWARVPAGQRQGVVRVKPVGDKLVLAPAGTPGTYAMDLRRFVLDDRDRKLRARLVGGAQPRVEPYHSRAELEALGLPGGVDAPVLAWVNDPLALYAMQVQGSGRIQMPDTSVLRVQYAEQNGHPFRPLRVVPKDRPVTRGAATPDAFVVEGDDEPDEPVVTRGAPRGDARPDPLVDELLQGGRRSGVPARAAPRPKAAAPSPAARLLADPSYVFFRVAADRPGDGPQGALGVPLTAGRSVAVDPRVTPLGYPMYLSAPAPSGSKVQLQRLVFAQDTGGAIRGALRADYFWGFGAEAGKMARRTRHRGQMWVMLPHAEAARLSASRLVTRGGAGGPLPPPGHCLVADGEFCAELDD